MTIAQNLDSMPVAQRDSLLISIAKEFIMKNGPDYYREYKPPVISHKKYEAYPDRRNDGRKYYTVTFLYDPAEETLYWDFAAKAEIWADNGNIIGVTFGNGIGVEVKEEGYDWRKSTIIHHIPYQDFSQPNYSGVTYNIPDSLADKPEKIKEFEEKQAALKKSNPLNKAILLKLGWEFTSDGEWVKTGPDIPPHKRKQQLSTSSDNGK